MTANTEKSTSNSISGIEFGRFLDCQRIWGSDEPYSYGAHATGVVLEIDGKTLEHNDISPESVKGANVVRIIAGEVHDFVPDVCTLADVYECFRLTGRMVPPKHVMSGQEYLDFMADPSVWIDEGPLDSVHHDDYIALVVDGKVYHQSDLLPDTIKPTSNVTIMSGDTFEGMTPLLPLYLMCDHWRKEKGAVKGVIQRVESNPVSPEQRIAQLEAQIAMLVSAGKSVLSDIDDDGVAEAHDVAVARLREAVTLPPADEIESVIWCARRVHSKFGSDSDWSEWRDLRDSLADLDRWKQRPLPQTPSVGDTSDDKDSIPF